jgi:hypothetical protein
MDVVRTLSFPSIGIPEIQELIIKGISQRIRKISNRLPNRHPKNKSPRKSLSFKGFRFKVVVSAGIEPASKV